MRIPWVVTGATAAAGVFWLVLGTLQLAELGATAVALSAIAGGLASGALIATHVPVRSTREPLAAALLGMVMAIAAMYAVSNSRSWERVGVPPGWLLLATPALGVTCGVASAEVMRRIKAISVSTLSVILLSAAVHFGALLVLFAAMTAAHVGESATVAVAFGGVVIAAFLTQLALPVRAPWASAGGMVLFPVFGYLNQESAGDMFALVVGSLVLMLVGRIGSAIANAITKPLEEAALPSARMR